MALADRLLLARRLAGASLALARDAVGSALGDRLPLGPEALTEPGRFARLVTAGAPGDRPPLGRPEAITLRPHQAPSSNCRNSVLALDWGEAEGPASVFVKQPSPQLPTRLFANVVGFWKTECAVARSLAAALPIATPRIHAVLESPSRFLLVMENLTEAPGAGLFVNRDLLEGADLPLAERCLQTLAKLHAGLAGLDAAERERALPIRLHPFRSPILQPVMLALNRQAVPACHARAPELFDPGLVLLYRHALERWPALEEAWYRGPPTLLHGDSHLGNFFRVGSGESAELGLLDFQAAHWGPGIRDVQYFLVNSLPADELARNEKRLVEGYTEELRRRGLPLDAAAVWERYRAFSFQTLMTAVVSLGLGSFTDSNAVMRSMLSRAAEAVRRLDFGRWLDALD